jgi:hypothetical protein
MEMLYYLNFLSLVPIFIISYKMYKDSIYTVIPICFPLLGLIWMGISIAYLETGRYAPIIFSSTYLTGAAIRYVVAISVFLLTYWCAFRLIINKKWLSNNRIKLAEVHTSEAINMFILVIGLAGILILIFHLPEERPDARVAYTLENPSFIRDLTFGYLPVIGFLFGFAAAVTYSARIRTLSYILATFIVVIIFLFGHKFSGIISYFQYFFVSYFIIAHFFLRDRPISIMRKVKKNIIIIILSSIITLLVIAGIVKEASISNKDIIEYLANRLFIEQGAMWWFTDYHTVYGSNLTGWGYFMDFVKSIDYDSNLSLIYLMAKSIGWASTYKIVFINKGILTGAFPAIFYEIGGVCGPVVFSAVSGIIIAIFAGYMTRKLIQKQFILLVIAVYMFAPVVSLIDSGEFLHLFRYQFIIKIICAIFLELIYVVQKQKPMLSKGLFIKKETPSPT